MEVIRTWCDKGFIRGPPRQLWRSLSGRPLRWVLPEEQEFMMETKKSRKSTSLGIARAVKCSDGASVPTCEMKLGRQVGAQPRRASCISLES